MKNSLIRGVASTPKLDLLLFDDYNETNFRTHQVTKEKQTT